MTHGVSFLPHVDEIVVLVDGVVSEVGTYKYLRASKGAFSEFLNTYAQEQNNRTKSESGNYPKLPVEMLYFLTILRCCGVSLKVETLPI